MHKFKVDDPAGHIVGSGEIMGLTKEQLATRSHRVERVEDPAPGPLTIVRVLEPIQFKAGEVLHLDRAPKAPGAGAPAAAKPPATETKKRDRRDANGDTPEMAQLRGDLLKAHAEQLTTARAEGVKSGRLAMLEEIKARNALIDESEAAGAAVVEAKKALDAEADADKRKPLQKALDAALEAEEKANKAVDDLPEIEG